MWFLYTILPVFIQPVFGAGIISRVIWTERLIETEMDKNIEIEKD